MTPYVTKYVSPSDQELFKKICNAVHALPDLEFGTDESGRPRILSCHILARAVARVFKLRVVDGLFYPNYQHSWVITNGEDDKRPHVIDVYPIAALGGPNLIDGTMLMSPAHSLYVRVGRNFYSGKFVTKEFKASVTVVVREMRKQIKLQAG